MRSMIIPSLTFTSHALPPFAVDQTVLLAAIIGHSQPLRTVQTAVRGALVAVAGKEVIAGIARLTARKISVLHDTVRKMIVMHAARG